MAEESFTDQHIRRGLEAHGVNNQQINMVLAAHARLRAQDENGRTPRMSQDIQSINASLQEVGKNIKAYKESTEAQVGEFSARLGTVEQMVAKIEQEGPRGAGGGFGGPSIGASALERIHDDGGFQAASEQAARGMKVSRFDARVNVDGSIRAALTNTGRGGSGDTAYPTWSERRPDIYGPVIPAPRLLDVLPSRPTSSDKVEFIQLAVTGDAAEQETEGDLKAELDFDGEKLEAEIVTIAGWTAASKQVLADAAGLQAAIDRTIRLKVLSRLENRLINGTGGSGKINGLLNQATTFLPTIGTSAADIIGEGLMRLQNSGYAPNLVVLNPLDFFSDIQIVKNPTTGEYMFGDPASPQGPNLWNTTIVRTPAMPQGQGLVLDTAVTTVLDREQMSIALSNSHADFFIRNLIAILGELRAGLEVLDPGAIYKFELPAPASGP
ncbi:phage major capsid protein [Stenotrophomonas sp. MMGLT7]|uniref:phage major capsid protein n=1 Tax=Stenotrophomonas sp. MMGLT7 TaxID=2901227 RepID=UPI001E6445C2|nr:phage major capsid protein [Stenotrophomonas sp. MMGLT7]MCD7097177.1 phage major capsid protein [Stenotrophomonas sp. MMGLT7]